MIYILVLTWVQCFLLVGAGIGIALAGLFIYNNYCKMPKQIRIGPPGNGNLTRIRILNTELTNKEAALLHITSRFSAVIDYAPILIGSFDKNGVIDLWNNECVKVLKYEKDEIVGNPNAMHEFYPNKKVYNSVQKHIKNASKKFKPFTARAKGGKKVTCAWAIVNLPDATTLFIGYRVQNNIKTTRKSTSKK